MSNRPETGSLQFGEDWPGTFIRGDNAMYLAYSLEEIVREAQPGGKITGLTPLQISALENLHQLLSGADAFRNIEGRVVLKPYEECTK